MKICYNCKHDVRDSDIYCRTCGCLLQKNSHYVIINLCIIFVILCILGLIALFVASYLVE